MTLKHGRKRVPEAAGVAAAGHRLAEMAVVVVVVVVFAPPAGGRWRSVRWSSWV